MREFYFAQKAFIVSNNHLLAIQKSLDDPNQPGKWEVPGGRMDWEEGPKEHIKREIYEEVGLAINLGKPFYVWHWFLEREKNGMTLYMKIVALASICYTDKTDISNLNQVEEDYISSIQWIPFENIDKMDWIENMYPVIEAFKEEMKLS